MTWAAALLLVREWWDEHGRDIAKRRWRDVLIAVLCLLLWGTWSCRGKAVERAEARVIAAEQQSTAAIATSRQWQASCREMQAGMEQWQAAAREQERKTAEANATVRSLLRSQAAALHARDVAEAALRDQLAALPPEARPCVTADWAYRRAMEVSRDVAP